MTELYATSKQDVSYHLKNIFETFELEENSTVKNFLTVQKEGSREVKQDKLYKSDFDLLLEEELK